MRPPDRALPETDERCCPTSRSHRIAPVGHVLIADGLLKAEHRCEVCGIGFFFVRKPLA